MSHTHLRVNVNTSCLNLQELHARYKRDIWSLSDFNGIRTHNHLVCKQTLHHLAKLSSLAKWLNVVFDLISRGFESFCSHLNTK